MLRLAAMLVLLTIAGGVQEDCEADNSALLQHAQAKSRTMPCQTPNCEPPSMLIITTPGGYQSCCDKGPDSYDKESPNYCKRKSGTKTLQMGEAFKAGAKAICDKCKVDLRSLTDETCPTADEIRDYDAIAIGAPTWSNMPTPDMMEYLATWRPYSRMPCKLGAAFSGGSDFFGGVQPTVEILHRYLLAYSAFIVPSPFAGHSGEFYEGAFAGHSEEGYKPDEDGNIHPYYFNQSFVLGARLMNITRFVKERGGFGEPGIPNFYGQDVCGQGWGSTWDTFDDQSKFE